MTSELPTVGVFDHCGWAVLVTATGSGELLDRRRVALVDDDLPSLPYHHPAQHLPLEQALTLVDRVRESAERHAEQALAALQADVDAPLCGIAMRVRPPLPASVAERIQSYWAQTRADSVMYRDALAAAAQARGWSVYWYEPKSVVASAGEALQLADPDAHFAALRQRIGPPWTKDHRLAMAAAVAASAEAGRRR